MAEVPNLHFRLRDNGALVLRVETDNRQQRMDLRPIASVNARNGTIRPHGQNAPTEAEEAEIRDWIATRAAALAAAEAGLGQRTLEALGEAAQWAQNRADDDQVEAVTDALLMAMHDLRSVLIRRRANRLMRDEPAGPDGDGD